LGVKYSRIGSSSRNCAPGMQPAAAGKYAGTRPARSPSCKRPSGLQVRQAVSTCARPRTSRQNWGREASLPAMRTPPKLGAGGRSFLGTIGGRGGDLSWAQVGSGGRSSVRTVGGQGGLPTTGVRFAGDPAPSPPAGRAGVGAFSAGRWRWRRSPPDGWRDAHPAGVTASPRTATSGQEERRPHAARKEADR
jgi:hypothetical protein